MMNFIRLMTLLIFFLPSLVISQPQQPQILDEDYHTEPGIILFRDGKWLGTDNLFNLSNQLHVEVEILKRNDIKKIAIEQGKIQKRIEEKFKENNLDPISAGTPLPLFHVLIMSIDTKDGFLIYISTRLFEKVELERVRLPEEAHMQAITWENQNLLFSTEKDVETVVNNNIDELVNSFIQRFKHFERIRTERDPRLG